MTLIEKAEEAIDNIRPYMLADGGNIRVLEITEDMIVKVELQGACGECPMSSMTMKAGVEDAIKRAIPEVRSVVAVNVNSEAIL
jgi:Fe-S cluster biogenesis protein NfuA